MSEGIAQDEQREPIVPVEVDLRDFPYMPFDINRLFNSEFHARSSDAEWRAGVTLWLKAFHQVPAASLPDDDILLARLAEYGRDVEGWKAVRAGALHGWIKCSDGRLYHPVVAEKALEAWSKRKSQSKRGKLGNAKRWAKSGPGTELGPAKKKASSEVEEKDSSQTGRCAIAEGSQQDKKFFAQGSQEIGIEIEIEKREGEREINSAHAREDDPPKKNLPAPTPALARERRRQQQAASRFGEFWARWTGAKSREHECFQIWQDQMLDTIADEIIADLEVRQTSDVDWQEGFGPRPYAYLMGRRWKDDIATQQRKKPRGRDGFDDGIPFGIDDPIRAGIH